MDNKRIKDWLKKRKSRKDQLDVATLLQGITNKDAQYLSAGITLLESTRSEDREVATSLVKASLPHSGKSTRIGITGVPGVGKSTFIETFGQLLLEQGKRVAILAIDPSSGSSGGSILGDKTRMQELSQLENVFIRPSATGGALGGVAQRTRESIILCEAAQYDIILIETVGVGQSETMVHSMVDFFLLLMLSGAGDELQGIKRGIMEMADALVITKTDGDNVKKANLARKEYQNAMHLFPPKKSEWTPKALTCSSVENNGMDKIWEVISSYVNLTTTNGFFTENRKQQDKFWLKEALDEKLLQTFYAHPKLEKELEKFYTDIDANAESSFSAAEKLYQLYKEEIKHGRI